MKLGILIGIILGIVIVGVAIIAIVASGILPIGRQITINSSTTSTPLISSPVISNRPASSNIPASPNPLVSAQSSPALSSTLTPASTTLADVNFGLNVTSINYSQLTSVVVTAQVSNTGTSDAHNVQAKVSLTSGGSQIKINGQDYLTVPLGTVKAGITITQQVTLNINLIDGLNAARNGATFNLTIYSDEKTQTFTYEYRP